ncbi:MAG: hypothetical protein KJZ86_14785 [Caldilineaceae bacterium]|nr:hypothetical protein [Caldilineaceae bacterium]HRJ44095.1 hypothetical protein [Caldilineaceae bacterium]
MLEQISAITGVSARYWQSFETVSPGGHAFSGYLCRQESKRFGMLAITQLDGQERLEFVYAMPKIHYPYAKETDTGGEEILRVEIPVPPDTVDARFTHKLDGTAIIFYPLTAPDGQVLEVVPRTRLQPVVSPSRWGNWNTLIAEAMPDRSAVERAVTEERVVLIFELWGYRNAHLVTYDTPLAMTLHTAVHNGQVVSYQRLAEIAGKYGLDLVDSVAVLSPDSPGLALAYQQLQAEMESRNQAVDEGVFAEEGAILMLSTAESATLWKCKPPSVEEIHWAAGVGLGKTHVVQALHKMLENGYDFGAGAVADLHTMLESDFEPTQIEYASPLVLEIYNEFVDELNRQARLRQLVEASGLGVTDLPNLMRSLAAHYSKNQMGWVYATVKRLYGL